MVPYQVFFPSFLVSVHQKRLVINYINNLSIFLGLSFPWIPKHFIYNIKFGLLSKIGMNIPLKVNLIIFIWLTEHREDRISLLLMSFFALDAHHSNNHWFGSKIRLNPLKVLYLEMVNKVFTLNRKRGWWLGPEQLTESNAVLLSHVLFEIVC